MRKRINSCYIILSFFSFSFNAYSQQPSNGVIKGRIIAPDNKPLPYATLLLKSYRKKTVSDKNGNFELNGLPTLKDTLLISSVTIKTYKIPVSVNGGNELNIGDIQVQYSVEKLQDVEITGRIAQSYKSDYSFLGTKTQTALKDIPQSISTVTKELIKDKMEFRLKDALDDVAGVNQYSGYDEYAIRGFRADNAHLINGLRAYNTALTNPMLVNIERIEVIKGPTSVLYGNGDPGGTINMVTKKPLGENQYGFDVYAGSWNTFRAQADVTGPVNKSKSLLYRFNAGYENEESFRNQFFAKSFEFAPSLSYIPNEKVRLNADFSISHTSTVADRGQPGFLNDNTLKSTPISLMVTQPGDHLNETDITSIISFSYKFNNHITFNSAVLNYFTSQQLAEHGIQSYITPDSVYLYYTRRNFNTITTTLTNYASFAFNTGGFKHQLVAGYDFINNSINVDEFNGELPDQFGNGSGIVGTFSLKNPQYFNRPVNTYQQSDEGGGDGEDAYTTQGVYVQEQVAKQKWQMLLGLREEFYYSGGGDSGSTRENVFLPRIGLVYAANDHVSFYATYNRGFDPYEASVIVQVFNEPFKPINSEVMEAGAKATLIKNKLYASLALYQLTLKNVAVNANDPSNPDLYTQRGEEQAKGIEAEMNGNILSNLSVTLSYSHNIAKVIKSEVPEEIGKIKENAPENTSASWIKYVFNKGFARGFGISAGHSQESARNTLTDGLTLPGYCVVNAGLSYQYAKFKIAANVYNIANTVYWTGGYNYASKWPGAPRHFMINFAYGFGK